MAIESLIKCGDQHRLEPRDRFRWLSSVATESLESDVWEIVRCCVDLSGALMARNESSPDHEYGLAERARSDESMGE